MKGHQTKYALWYVLGLVFGISAIWVGISAYLDPSNSGTVDAYRFPGLVAAILGFFMVVAAIFGLFTEET